MCLIKQNFSFVFIYGKLKEKDNSNCSGHQFRESFSEKTPELHIQKPITAGDL